MKIGIIQLARAGDILLILPLCEYLHNQGHTVYFYCHESFAYVLDGIGYVTPVAWKTTHTDLGEAAKHAAGYCDRVFVTQDQGNETPPFVRTEHFSTQAWQRAGYMELFHELPLHVGQPTGNPEVAIVKSLMRNADKPTLAYALLGYSCGLDRDTDRALRQWIIKAFGGQYNLLDIATLRRISLRDLVPILERCAALISVDTAIHHLAYATGTPTVVITPFDRAGGFASSEPRSHWIARIDQNYVMRPANLAAIVDAVERRDELKGTLVRPWKRFVTPKLTHVVDSFVPIHPFNKRYLAAEMTWRQIAKADSRFTTVKFTPTRTSKDIGDNRNCTYVKDLFDFAATQADPYVVVTNPDVFLCPEAASVLRDKLDNAPCCYSQRIDFRNITPAMGALPRAELAKHKPYAGTDLFAFTRNWWASVRDELPDVILGYEGWDWIWRQLMRRDCPTAETSPVICYHEMHQSEWAKVENILQMPGQIYNRELCLKWARDNGYEWGLTKNCGQSFIFTGENRETTPKRPVAAEAARPMQMVICGL